LANHVEQLTHRRRRICQERGPARVADLGHQRKTECRLSGAPLAGEKHDAVVPVERVEEILGRTLERRAAIDKPGV
jgi:hypothetical protein